MRRGVARGELTSFARGARLEHPIGLAARVEVVDRREVRLDADLVEGLSAGGERFAVRRRVARSQQTSLARAASLEHPIGLTARVEVVDRGEIRLDADLLEGPSAVADRLAVRRRVARSQQTLRARSAGLEDLSGLSAGVYIEDRREVVLITHLVGVLVHRDVSVSFWAPSPPQAVTLSATDIKNSSTTILRSIRSPY